MMRKHLELTCPRCVVALMEAPERYECPSCGTGFPVADGIADLRMGRRDYYFNPVARPQMREIISGATKEGWSRAIRRFMAEVSFNPDWMDNLVADGRYAWKLFLELAPDARVLDLGCGLGNLTKNLAPHVGEMCALDLTWERLQFAKRRFSIFNPDDRITLVAGGDGDHLPFADATFDAVMISGVLEWVADDSSLWADARSRPGKVWRMIRAHFGRTNPRRVQRRFLQEVRRVLKPTGFAFIGIENRLSHEYFGHRPDHHSGLWFGSLLPRPVATLYSIARSRAPYRTYTYAHPGYRRLLSESGFAGCKFLGLTPGYSHLSEIIPFDDDSGRWRAPKDTGSKDSGFAASKLFVPAYGIVASASQSAGRPRASLIERIACEAAVRAGCSGSDLRLSSLKIIDDAVAIAEGRLRDKEVMLRIPLNEYAAAAEDAHHSALVAIVSDHPRVKDTVPVPITRGRAQNLAYYVEAPSHGQSMIAALASQGLEAILDATAEFLQLMNPDLPQGPAAQLNSDVFREEVERPLALLGAAIDDSSALPSVRAALSDLLLGAEVRFGLTHGNLLPKHLTMSNGAINSVSNWDCWSPAGLPILDGLRFAQGVLEESRLGLSPHERIALLGDLQALPAPLRAFVQNQYSVLGLDPSRHQGFVHLLWLQHTAKRIETIALDPRRLESSVETVLKELATRKSRMPVSRAAA